MADDTDIIQLSDRTPDRRFRVVGLDRAPACRHRETVLQEAQRMLACQECGTLIDPFDWLMQIASLKAGLDVTYLRLRDQIDGLDKTLASRRREAARVKAEIKLLEEERTRLAGQLRLEFGLPDEQLRKIREKLK
jgi:ribosomal protein S27E